MAATYIKPVWNWHAELELQGSALNAVTNCLFHHIGTTWMHDHPWQGVVDRDCAVHGLSNFYIAGIELGVC